MNLPRENIGNDEPIVSIRDVCKSYGEKRVLRGISFDVMRGEVACIIGGSGSGKSTLIRCINGLTEIDSGSITIEGQDVHEAKMNKLQLRKKVAIVFQHYSLFPHRTALQNVMMAPLIVLQEDPVEAEARAKYFLERVNLRGKEDCYPAELRGSEQQRVAIARSMAMNPDVMLFDEVTVNLDPETVNDVLNTIKDLVKSGMTCIMVTHRMNFVKELAAQILFLYRGTIIESGPPNQLLSRPLDARTRKYLQRIL